MERRTFFRNLAIGLAAAPVIAKVVAETKPLFTYRRVNEWQPGSVTDKWAEQNRRMMEQIARHIANTDPYATLLRQELTPQEIEHLVSSPVSI